MNWKPWALCVMSSSLFAAAGWCVVASGQEVIWTYDAPIGFIDSSPAIADTNDDGSPDVVVTTTAGSIIVIDAAGRKIWMRGGQIPISIPPTVADVLGDPRPEVLALNQAGQLFCLDGLAGNPLWKWNLPGKVDWGMTAIVACDLNHDLVREIVVADNLGNVSCLSGEGQPLWQYRGTHGAAYSPAIGNVTGDAQDEVLIGGSKSPLVCLSASGQRLWQLDRQAAGSSPILVDFEGDGSLEIVVGVGSELLAVDGDGKVLWSQALPGAIDSGLAAADADQDGTPEIYAVDLSGHLHCLSIEGKLRWSASVKMRARRNVSIGDIDGDDQQEIVVSGYSAEVYVYSPEGKLEATLPLPAATNATPTIGILNGRPRLVCPSTAGAMTVFGWSDAKPDATLLWPQYRYDAARAGMASASRSSQIKISDIDFGNFYVGVNTLHAEIDNPSGQSVTVLLEVLRQGQAPLREETVSSNQTLHASLPYDLSGRETTRLSLRCQIQMQGRAVAQRSRQVTVVPFQRELADLTEQLEETAQAAATLADPAAIEGKVRRMRMRLPAFQRQAQVAGTLPDLQRRALRDAMAQTVRQADRLHQLTRVAADMRAAGKGPLLLSRANPWAPFGHLEEIVEGRLHAPNLVVEAFAGEIESAALNLFNLGNRPLTVRVEVDPLQSDTNGEKRSVPARGVVLLHETIDVPTQTLDLSADAIPALNQAHTMTLPGWAGRQLWLNVDTSRLAAGTWTTEVRLRTLEVESRQFTAPLRITVWKAKLPAQQALRLCHWGYVSSSILKDQPEAALQDQVSHGTNVFVSSFVPHARFNEEGELLGQIDYAAHDDYVRRHAPHGLLLFQHTGIVQGPTSIGSPAYRKAHIGLLRAWVEHLAQMGVGYDGFALYPVDEPGLRDGLVETYLQYAKLAREADPKIQMYTDPVARITLEQVRQMLPYVDIWCPNRVGFLLGPGKEKLELMQASGKTLWNYECAGNAKHQSPLSYYRGQAWLAWHHGLTGIGFWSYCTSSADPWYRPRATLDYLLIYPGEGVVTSKRWEAIRDGIEDYGMLTVLRAAVAKKRTASNAKQKALKQARKLLGEQAAAIGRFCGLEDEGTEPGKEGMPGARRTADRRWHQLQQIRREMATLLAELGGG